jgi:hypothetical protein
MEGSIWNTCMLVPGLSRSDCASWVQAWGTIGALAVAIGVARSQAALARKLQAEQASTAQKERAARSEYRWLVSLAVVSHLRRAATQIIGILRSVPSATMRATALALLDDAHRRLIEAPIFDLPDAGFADDLLALAQSCCMAREALVVAPGYEIASMQTIVVVCEKILEKVIASGMKLPSGATTAS